MREASYGRYSQGKCVIHQRYLHYASSDYPHQVKPRLIFA